MRKITLKQAPVANPSGGHLMSFRTFYTDDQGHTFAVTETMISSEHGKHIKLEIAQCDNEKCETTTVLLTVCISTQLELLLLQYRPWKSYRDYMHYCDLQQQEDVVALKLYNQLEGLPIMDLILDTDNQRNNYRTHFIEHLPSFKGEPEEEQLIKNIAKASQKNQKTTIKLIEIHVADFHAMRLAVASK